jgi:hypothetical protein
LVLPLMKFLDVSLLLFLDVSLLLFLDVSLLVFLEVLILLFLRFGVCCSWFYIRLSVSGSRFVCSVARLR